MADAAVNILINNLTELLLHHVHQITNAESDIERLQKDLLFFKAFLEDYANERRKDELSYYNKELVQSIRDVVYEAEDIIDDHVTHAAKRKAGNPFLNTLISPLNLHKIASKLQGIKENVNQAKAGMAGMAGKLRVNNEDKHENTEVRPPRLKDVVGFQDVTEELTCRLIKVTDYFDVVSLIGMFGLGKTTLAWKIFNDPRIQYEFSVRIWIVVSQELSENNILLAILKGFTTITDEIRQKSNGDLAKMVYDHLLTPSFLIVFDDVWSSDHWNRIWEILPSENNKGKVLITSREVAVGKLASKPRLPKELRFFTEIESWELLRLEALGKLDCPSELEGVGKLIASHCKGLPLAIVIIGGILGTKFSASDESGMRKEWEEVSTRVSAYLHDVQQNDLAARMKKFISLSYNRLPNHLRTCFLYLGMFPEDDKIPASKLIQMWIAEGFIQRNNYSTLEKTGEKYLDDLINRNLIKIDKMKSDGKVKTCQIHDTLRDFCRIEAGNGNENLFQEIKFNDGVFAPPASELQKCRRLYIHSNYENFISKKPTVLHVHSFVCLSEEKFDKLDKISDFVEAIRFVRVLDIKPFRLTNITRSICELFHVKYLSISLDSQGRPLPSKFSQLWNIQTLIVNTASSTLEVKADIWKMNQLRHFKTNAPATVSKPSKDSKHGAQLQTLGTISVESCTAELFDRACHLKKLGIRGKLALLLEGNMKSLDSLRKMEYLEKLKLINDVSRKLHRLPQPDQFPSKLRSLTLVSTFLGWDVMSSVLGQFPKLEVLKLKNYAFKGNTWEAVGNGFPCLEFLLIEVTDLAIWHPSNHHFPALKSLVLKNCDKLLEIPIGLADVASFQMLDLYVCKSAFASAKKIEEKKKEMQSAFKLSIFPPDLMT